MDCFVQIVNDKKLLTFFVEHSTLDVWQVSKYASVLCCSLFGKTEDANKNDSAGTKIQSF